MEGAGPARLYATVVGGLLVVGGIAGFFFTSSFGSPGEIDDVFGIFAANGWDNVVCILTGALGLLVAGFAARRYAFLIGLGFLAVAVWGFLLGGDGTILGVFPVNTADNLLHLAIGLLGLAAAVSKPAVEDARPSPAT